MGLSVEEAKQMAQRALDDAETEFDDIDSERSAYADAVAQQQYEFFLASGFSYEQAMAEGQAALNFAEADYDTMLADQQAYADAVAQQTFEMALQMGYSYPDAVAEGQRALEAAEYEYSQSMMQRMQFTPQVQAAMQAAAAKADSKKIEAEQDELLVEFEAEPRWRLSRRSSWSSSRPSARLRV